MNHDKLKKLIIKNRDLIEKFTVWFHGVMAFIFAISAYGALRTGRQEAGLLYVMLSMNFFFTASSEHGHFFIKKLQRNTIDKMSETVDELTKNYEDFILSVDEKAPNAVINMKNQIKELRIKRATALKEIDKKL